MSLLLGVMGVTSSVRAQGETDEEKTQKAKKAFEAGMAHYVSDEYADAIVDFKRAQRIYPSATLLYNIALAQRGLGKAQEAAQTAREALDFEGENRELGRESRTKAHALIAGGQIVEGARGAGRAVGGPETSSPSGTDSPSERPPPREPPPRMGGLGWSGLVTGIVGLGGLIGIPVLANQYSRDIEQLRQLQRGGGSRAEFQTKRDEAVRTRNFGIALLYAAPAVTAIGAGLVVLDLFVLRGSRASAKMQVTPTGRWSLRIQW